MEPTTAHALVERYLEMINKRDWDAIDTLFSSVYCYHGASSGAGEPTPPEAIKRYFHHLVQALPDLDMRAELIVASNDYVVLRWAASGTHLGEHMGLPATGHHGTQTGIAIWRLARGQFVEGWQNQDDLALLQSA